MSKARQFFSDVAKTVKVYPWTLAKLVKVFGGGTVQEYLDGTKKVSKAVNADNVPWGGVSNKPSTYPPSSHSHTKAQISDFPSSLPANGGNADTLNGFSFINSGVAGTPKYVAGWGGGTPTGMKMYRPEEWTVKAATCIPRLGIGSNLPLCTDALAIDITSGNMNNYLDYVSAYSGETKNCPVSNMIGLRRQYTLKPNWSVVEIVEMYPVAGRQWICAYNYGWTPWRNKDIATNVSWSGVTDKPFTEKSYLNMTINTFANSSTIYGRVAVGSQWNGCKVFVSNRFATSTPCNQVNNIVGAVLNGTLEIDAYGAFVNGHMLSVDIELVR